ncbi:MAG: lysophospholipid acyltransferase family protein [Nitrospinota bacterium]
MGYLLAIIRFFTYVGVFIVFFLIGVTVHLIFFLSERQRKGWILLFTHWWAKTTCWVLNFDFKIEGGDLPQPGTLIVANHVGSPDIFVLGACFKGFFVSKAEISDWPFFNLLAWLGMTIFADRKHKRQVRSLIEKIESRLKSNCSVILFPEAQATDGADVVPFKSAVFESVVRAKRSVVPVAVQYHDGNRPTIAYYGDSFFKHMVTLLKNPRLQITVHVLPEISPGPDRHQLAKSSYELVRNRYLEKG